MVISKQLKDQIVKQTPGSVFCANDFCDLGSLANTHEQTIMSPR